MKECKECGVVKSPDAFSPHKQTRDKLQPTCKECKKAWLTKHRREHPEKWREYYRRARAKNGEKMREQARQRYAANREREARKYLAWRMNRDHGITIEEYDALISRPCELCGATEGIVLDHCHKTGALRGPLCQRCNTAIGKLGDDPARLRAAADYIERHA